MKALFSPEVTDDAFFEALAGRLGLLDENTDAIECLGEWSQGLRYVVRRFDRSHLMCIIEVELHDGKLWRHLSVSCARPPRLPTWEELRSMKELFLGDEKAVMVFPSKAEYVNDNERVLHLFSGPDGLPDFRSEYEVNGKPSI